MILDGSELADGDALVADVAIVGAGPAGIVTALELARAGLDVLLLESGQQAFDAGAQTQSDAASWDHARHAEMGMAVRRQVGGTSVIWGGRCVPFDPIDFERRDAIAESGWPIGYDAVAGYFQRACDWMQCGRAVFDGAEFPHLPPTIVPGLPDGDVRSSSFERWSLPTDYGRVYRQALESTRRLRLVTGVSCTQIATADSGDRIARLELRGPRGQAITAQAQRYVLSAGGLESTRLLLASPRADGAAIGNHSDHLGRWYMSHIEGTVASVRFTTPPKQTSFDYERDIDGVFVRRRFSFSEETQRRLGLPNIVAWLANPALSDPAHGSGALSFAYLALASPVGRLFAPGAQRASLTGHVVPGAPYPPAYQGPPAAHMRNVIREPGSTVGFIARFGAGRFLPRRKLPGFFVYSPRNTYPLQFHGEHLPYRESRVTLAQERDRSGLPRLQIDIRFGEDDVDGVVRTHRLLDEHLRRHDRGMVEYPTPDFAESVRSHLGGGFHQSGTTRMARRPEDGGADQRPRRPRVSRSVRRLQLCISDLRAGKFDVHGRRLRAAPGRPPASPVAVNSRCPAAMHRSPACENRLTPEGSAWLKGEGSE